LPDEKIVSLACVDLAIANYLFKNYDKFKTLIDDIAQNSTNSQLKKRALTASKKAIVSTEELKNISLPYNAMPKTVANRNRYMSKNYAWNQKSKN
jgi:hypothetical protein